MKLDILALEDRLALSSASFFGSPWISPQLTLSFVDENTKVAGLSNQLENHLSQSHSKEEWQRDVLLAYQKWVRHTNLNIGVVNDKPIGLSSPGLNQGDPRFGDIRLASVPLDPSVLAVASAPNPGISGTQGGDIVLNSNYKFDGSYNLHTTLLHEAGHTLGLGHSTDPNSPMYPVFNNTKTDLTMSDIAALQQLYGARLPDANEEAQNNDATSRATIMKRVDPTRTPLLAYGDLTTSNDVDVFAFDTVAGSSNGDDNVTVRLQSSGLSLLAAKIQVFFLENGEEVEIANVTSNPDSATGSTVSVTFDANDEEGPRRYFIRVEKADNTEFDIGKFAVAVTFDGPNSIKPQTLDAIILNPSNSLKGSELATLLQNPSNTFIAVDHRTNNTISTATTLSPVVGTAAREFEAIGSIHSTSDVDVYRLTAPVGTSVLSTKVWALHNQAIQPRVEVLNAAGAVVPSKVIVNDAGIMVTEIEGVSAGAIYFVRVSTTPSNRGNFYVNAQFKNTAISFDIQRPVNFTNGTPVKDTIDVSHVMKFFFNLNTTGQNLPAAASVRMRIKNSSGEVVFERDAKVGTTVSGSTEFLKPGRYSIEYQALHAGIYPDRLGFNVSGQRIVDPIGPLVDDPTLEVTNRDPVDPDKFRYAFDIVSANPFYWYFNWNGDPDYSYLPN
jgi:hypothetical protein